MLRLFGATVALCALAWAAPQGSQYPDNYSVYVRALQHDQQPATPAPYGAPHSQSGGYSPPLSPPQSYRPPLQQNQSPYGGQAAYNYPQPVAVAPTPAPAVPQARPYSGYQPPLAPPYSAPISQPQQVAAPAQSQPSQVNNQQLIYVGGQQRQYNSPPPQAPQPSSQGQGHSSSSSSAGPSFSTSFTSDQANRQSKVVGSAQQAPAQAIQKAPASEIQFDNKKGTAAKDKDGNKKDDEYVIYYYYYYDEKDKKNLTLNFDDIPNLEQYDKENKTGRAHQVVAVPNSLQSNRAPLLSSAVSSQNEFAPTQAPRSATAVSVSVSVSEGPHQASPISNVFRYGSGEIPRGPIVKPTPEGYGRPLPSSSPETLGNTVVSSEPRPSLEESSVAPTVAVGPEAVAESNLEKPAEDINDVGDQKKSDIKKPEVEPETTTVTEASTTEEITTTEAPKRGSGFGNRKRYNGPTGNRLNPTRRPSSATTSAASSSASSTRRNPLNRQRPTRRPLNGDSARLRPSRPSRVRTTSEEPPAEEEEDHNHNPESSSTTTQSTSTTGAPRRFGANNRSRFQSTRSTTLASEDSEPKPSPRPLAGRIRPTRPATGLARARTSGRPRRPPFARTKAPEEDEPKEEASTTTPEEPSKSSDSPATSEAPQAASSAPEESPETHKDPEVSEETSTAPTRRNPLLRPRSRNPLLGNRPPRTGPLIRAQNQ